MLQNVSVPDKYVGSTTEKTKRNYAHKESCPNPNSKSYNRFVYQFIREHGSWDNWDMILVEKYPCSDKLELLQRERYWTEHLGAKLNKQTNQGLVLEIGEIAYKKQHFQDNKDKISEQQKQYYENNKQNIFDKQKSYRESHKAEIQTHQNTKCECICGGKYTLANKVQHLNTKSIRIISIIKIM